MKNKHLEIKRRIEDAKLKITDAELFGSRLYGAVLSDIAETVSHRYRRGCRVLTFWDEGPNAMVAQTNNRTIQINAGNYLTRSLPKRKLKDLSLRGLLGHELGHVLFSDFNMLQVYNAKLAGGEFYPRIPADLTEEEQESLDELQELMASKDRSTILVLQHAGNSLTNVMEDVYIEGRMCDAYPGTFAQGIGINNLRFADTMPTVAEQIKNNDYGFSIVVNLMIQYCKTGDVNNLTNEKSEYLDALYDCLPMIDEACYDDDGKARFEAANHLIVHLWPYLKELRKDAENLFGKGKSEEEVAEEITEALAKQIASMAGTPTGSGKGVHGGGSGHFGDGKEARENRTHEAQEVMEEEGKRIALTETDTITSEGDGEVTYDDGYTGSGYDKAAEDIEHILTKLAESRVCTEEETEFAAELQQFSDDIDYGDAHAGVNIHINRMASVPDELISAYDRVCDPLLTLSKRLQKQVSQVLKDRRNGGKETGLLFGHRLLVRSLYHNDGRYFYKNRLPQDTAELAVALLVDESGSMSCAHRITTARAASIVVYDFCKSLGIPILVLGHTEGIDVELYSYAEFDAKDKNDRYRLMDMAARSGNRDGAALRYTAERLLRRPEEIKLLILISDGQPAAEGYYGTAAEADLRSIKREYTRRGITLFAAAIGEDKENIERIYGDGFLDISNLDDLPINLTRLIAQRIKRK